MQDSPNPEVRDGGSGKMSQPHYLRQYLPPVTTLAKASQLGNTFISEGTRNTINASKAPVAGSPARGGHGFYNIPRRKYLHLIKREVETAVLKSY